MFVVANTRVKPCTNEEVKRPFVKAMPIALRSATLLPIHFDTNSENWKQTNEWSSYFREIIYFRVFGGGRKAYYRRRISECSFFSRGVAFSVSFPLGRINHYYYTNKKHNLWPSSPFFTTLELCTSLLWSYLHFRRKYPLTTKTCLAFIRIFWNLSGSGRL